MFKSRLYEELNGKCYPKGTSITVNFKVDRVINYMFTSTVLFT